MAELGLSIDAARFPDCGEHVGRAGAAGRPAGAAAGEPPAAAALPAARGRLLLRYSPRNTQRSAAL